MAEHMASQFGFGSLAPSASFLLPGSLFFIRVAFDASGIWVAPRCVNHGIWESVQPICFSALQLFWVEP